MFIISEGCFFIPTYSLYSTHYNMQSQKQALDHLVKFLTQPLDNALFQP